LATILLNAGVLWILYLQETEARHREFTVATSRALRAQLEVPRGVDARGWRRRVLQSYRKADMEFEELWVVDRALQVEAKAAGVPPLQPDVGMRLALFSREEHVEWVGRYTGNPSVVVTQPLMTGGAVNAALRVRLPWDGGSFFGGRLGILLSWTALSGSTIAVLGYILFRRRLLGPIQQIQEATLKIAGGQFGYRVEQDSARELQELSQALTTMSLSLGAYRERTAEQVRSLEEANAQLTRIQEELIRSEKLASVGRLAAGIAHELGNPLAAVAGYTELLASDLEDPTLEADLLARSGRELERMQVIIRDLLDFARPGRGTTSPALPGVLVDEALGTVRHQPSFRHVALVREVPPAMPEIVVEPERVQQVLVNLLINAGDAMGGEGRVAISALPAEEGGVVITVHDSGPGFTPDDLPKVFDPFFTTKPPGAGTGLGLSICQRIVDGMGGTIRAGNHPEGGAVVTVTLPAEPPAEAG